MGKQLRKFERRRIQLAGTIYARDGKALVQCELRDISKGGARLALPRELELPQEFLLSLSADGYVLRQCKKAWQFSILVGVQFVGSS